jgi:hypothetical protein
MRPPWGRRRLQRGRKPAVPAIPGATGNAPRIALGVLKAGPLAARDIATRTGLCHPTVKEALRLLRREGVVTTGGPYRQPLYQLAARAASS